MDDTLLFIPPCCVDKKLPQALVQAPHRALTFYTHGDVTMEKFYRAISYMVEDAHVMVLTMPVLEAETAVFLSQCFEREWITHLVLSSSRDCTQFIDRHLNDFRSRLLYAQNSDVTELSSHLVLYNKDRALTLVGPMYARTFNNTRLVQYSAMFYPCYNLCDSQHDWCNPLRNVLMPDVLRHRQQVRKDKRDVYTSVLNHFLHMEFPPYDNE